MLLYQILVCTIHGNTKKTHIKTTNLERKWSIKFDLLDGS